MAHTMGMRRVVGITAAWMAATFVAIVIAATAVASVRTEVTDTPTALGEPAIVTVTTGPEPDQAEQSASSVSIVETTTTSQSRTVGAETTSTTVQVDTSPDTTTTTNTPPVTAPSTTTSVTVAGYTKTYDTEAGSVRVTVSGGSVSFSGATPLPGWKVELENSGPEEVKVHFERNDDEEEEIKFMAKLEDGELKVSISASDDD